MKVNLLAEYHEASGNVLLTATAANVGTAVISGTKAITYLGTEIDICAALQKLIEMEHAATETLKDNLAEDVLGELE
jgi:hypothetical protein